MAEAPLLGEVAGEMRLDLAISLPLRDSAQLDELIQEISNPRSPRYREYLTPDQFTARFAGTDSDYQGLIEFCENTDGLTITGTHEDRIVLDVAGTVASIKDAFHVTLQTRRRPDGTEFYAPDREPSLDLDIPVMHITGLDNYIVPKAHNGSAPNGQFGGSDFRNAYASGSTLTGAGQTVTLFELDGFYTVDINNYKSQFDLNVPVQVVTLNGYSQTASQSGPNGTPGGDQGEVALDIEMAMAMAPGLQAVIVVEGSNPDSVLAAMATPGPGVPLSRQLSASYTFGITPTSQVLVNKMAVQGQTFFVAAGDGHAFCPNEWVGGSRTLSNVTVVGGTLLSMSGDGQSWLSESAGANGGGVEIGVPIPAYQEGLATTANGGSNTWRNVPDVAMISAGVFIYVNNGGQEVVGGTSVATPLWAAYIALVHEQALLSGRGYVGFINPAIYSIGGAPALYAKDFHDIQSGTSKLPTAPCSGYIGYDAVAGYDLVTGWGTPTAALIGDLAAPPDFATQPSLVAVAAWGPGRLDIVAPGSDGTLLHKAWTGTQWYPSASGWESLGGEYAGSPSMTSWGPDRLDIFMPFTNEGTMAHKAWTGGAWYPAGEDWENLGGYLGQPAVASWGPGRLDVFAVDGTNVMRHKAWTGAAWAPAGSGWDELGGQFITAPAVASWESGRLDVFAVSTYGTLLHKAWTGDTWYPAGAGWEDLGGQCASAPAVASWGAGRLDVFVIGNDGHMQHKAWTGDTWYPAGSGFEDLGGQFT
jgi:Pro-kumamolisin, activation domain/Repeat of unknown function (DUF346)